MTTLPVSKVSFLFTNKTPHLYIHAGKVIITDGVAHCKDVWIGTGQRIPDMVASVSNVIIEAGEPAWWKDRHGNEDSYGNEI